MPNNSDAMNSSIPKVAVLVSPIDNIPNVMMPDNEAIDNINTVIMDKRVFMICVLEDET